MSEAIDIINRSRGAARRMSRLYAAAHNIRALRMSAFDMAPNRLCRDQAWQDAIDVIEHHSEEARKERDACMARLAVIMGQRA